MSIDRISIRGGLSLLLACLLAQAANAQEMPLPPSQETIRTETSERWIPLGPAPVDQAGTGGRGYVLFMEDADVTAPRANRISIHAVAANYFYREHTDDFLVSQRYETHTLAFDYRRGFKIQGIPRFEIGGHVQLHQTNGGMLNGFIAGFEQVWASLTGHTSAKNQLRRQEAAWPPQGTLISKGGSPLYRNAGTGAGLGDVYVLAKFALRDRDPSSNATRLSARAGINLGGRSNFSEGNFFGVGASLDKKLLERVAFHGDVRATRALDSVSVWNLPLKGWAYGFSAGSEMKLTTNSSFTLQIGGNSTPYLPTGTTAFDTGYGDLTVGLAHRFRPGARHVTMHIYARENLNLPFNVRWNSDPDLSLGIKATIH